MNEIKIFEQIKDRANWIVGIAHRKGWTIKTPLTIEGPATDKEISKVENQIASDIPADLKKLFKLSKHLEFRYQFDETLSEEFRQNFSGEIYWNLNTLRTQFEDFQEWIKASLDPRYNDQDANQTTKDIWQHKLALMDVPNGDVIAIGNNPSEIVYFSHEGDSMHGKVLGDNLWDFLDFYSRVGFAGSEDWQLEPFFDFETNKMVTKGEKVDKFISLLEK